MSHEDTRSGDQDQRRRYDRRWWKRDRRRVAPALLGGLSVLIPTQSALADVSSERTPVPSHDPPERDARRSANAIAGARLFAPHNEAAERQARDLSRSRPEDARLLQRIMEKPTAVWVGDWNGDVRRDVDRVVGEAAKAGAVPVLAVYNIPNRDCNQYSAGGLSNADEYRAWIRQVAAGIGSRRAVVVLEPDALALVSCLTEEGQAERFSAIRDAVVLLKKETGATVYIDAGHAEWVPEDEMALRLHLAGVEIADGFALNVSNFISTEANTRYGERLSSRVQQAHFVIDTSRNGGSVAAGEWCNPAGAALGQAPTTDTGHGLVDALLWIKRPGESDGSCNGGPAAGQWWGEYALDLARGAPRVAD